MSVEGGGVLDLLEAERRSIFELLNVNNRKVDNRSDTWKVLVYDKRGESILAPVFKLGELRHQGVTLNFLLHDKRYPVSDAAAIYFIEPTDANINQVCVDIRDGLYKSYTIEFIRPVCSEMLKRMAGQIAKDGAGMRAAFCVRRVTDRYLDLIAISPHIFTLGRPDSLSVLYSPKADDAMISLEMDRIVDGLLSLVRTLNVRPILRCSENPASPARAIAHHFDQKLKELQESVTAREGVSSWPNSPDLTSDLNNNLNKITTATVLLCDRSLDFQSMLQHTWTYEALIHDLFGIHLNRVRIPKEQSGSTSFQSLELNATDAFWMQHRNLPYPEVALSISTLLEDFNTRVKEIQQGSQTWGASLESSDITKNVAAALDAAPEIMEKKKSLDLHTNIAGALLTQIRDRHVDKFFETEMSMIDSLFGSHTPPISQIQQLIQDSKSGNYEDKLRLFLCLHLNRGQLTKAEIDRLAVLLQQNSPDPTASPTPPALRFLRHFESMSNLQTDAYNGAFLAASAGDTDTKPPASTTWSTVMGKSKGFFLQGVKHLIPIKHEFKIVKLVNTVLSSKCTNSLGASYTTLDPLDIGADSTVLKNCIVFMVGGGTYAEAGALAAWAQTNEKRVLYGSTEILRPCEFAGQLDLLGKAL